MTKGRLILVAALVAGVASCATVADGTNTMVETTVTRESNALGESETRQTAATPPGRTLIPPTGTGALSATGTYGEPESLPVRTPKKPTSGCPVPTPTGPSGTVPSSTPFPDETVQDNVRRAAADLARRLDAPVESVELISTAPDEFPASNLGCTEYGGEPERPIPALVTGQRILLEVHGRRYVYHAHGVRVVYCGTAEG